ncbi:MAG: hypothetical protein AB8G77_11485 [Rhodothermales bacterium]
MIPDRDPISRNVPPERRPVKEEPPAEEQLKFIRDVMARTSTFTAVPGWGAVGMGVFALIAAYVASIVTSRDTWLITWMVVAASAASLGSIALYLKSKKANAPLLSGPGRKFLASFLPPLFVGAVLTIALWHAGAPSLLPGTWMLMYGASVLAGGAYSVRIIPVMGMLFLGLGALTLFLPHAWGNVLMAVTFGGLHIVFGLLIAKYHGG